MQVFGRRREIGDGNAGTVWKQMGQNCNVFAGENGQWCEKLLEQSEKKVGEDVAEATNVKVAEKQGKNSSYSSASG